MSLLFTPLTLRSVTLPNRIALSPMCTYAADERGLANDWHLAHLGSRATGGSGLLLQEATAVLPEGRITPRDLGLWSDDQIDPLARINAFIHAQGAIAGVQLAHAGRKASAYPPGSGNSGSLPPDQGGWQTVGPSAIAFDRHYLPPQSLDLDGIQRVISGFASAARRALAAGFRVIELHAAHGYLLHAFLSPLSNQRQDQYGGSFTNRIRLLLETVAAVRQEWPEHLPLLVRLSATEWVDDGWSLEETVLLASRLKEAGVDLIDVSSGGGVANAHIPLGPGYQSPLAERVRREAGVAVSAVGLITSAEQAEHVLATGQADLVLLGRELLRDPYWPLHASARLDAASSWPLAYLRAAPGAATARQPL